MQIEFPFVREMANIVRSILRPLARVAWSLTEDVPLVLGRLDVFNEFDIFFKEREEKVIFIA